MPRIHAWLASIAILAAGCVTDTDRGDMVVAWTIGLSEPTTEECSASMIDSIEIALESPSHDDEAGASCTAGERTFSSLPVDGYAVRVRGLDASGCVVYAGSLANAVPGRDEPERVEVILGRQDPSGTLHVTWRFEDGMMCGAHGIEQVRLQVLSDDAWVTDTEIELRILAYEGPAELCYVATGLDLAPCDTLDVEASLEPCL
jgi:hypothetical protein